MRSREPCGPFRVARMRKAEVAEFREAPHRELVHRHPGLAPRRFHARSGDADEPHGIAFLRGDAGNDNGEVFKYPAGGSPIATFVGNFDEPLGTVASSK